MPEPNEDGPKTVFHPPFVMLLAIASAYAIRVVWGGILPIPRIVGEGLGTVLIIGSIIVLQMGIKTFAAGGEELRPTTPSRQLFTKGIYGYTRNPIYLAFMMLGIGLGLATLNIWTIGTTLFAGLIIDRFVISAEETYLETYFGTDYTNYQKRVRRWL